MFKVDFKFKLAQLVWDKREQTSSVGIERRATKLLHKKMNIPSKSFYKTNTLPLSNWYTGSYKCKIIDKVCPVAARSGRLNINTTLAAGFYLLHSHRTNNFLDNMENQQFCP